MTQQTWPQTPAELYDLLQALFGIGTYDDIASPEPWYRARMTEIGRLKRMLRARRVTVADVAVAAWYAHDRAIPIDASWRLFRLIAEAKREVRIRDRALRQSGLLAARNAAVIEAMEADEQGWADRLLNASDQEVSTVIDQWRNR